MPLNSVQQYVRGLLDNLEIPGTTDRLEAYIVPPTVEDIDRPKAYVQGARLRGQRQTMPRMVVGQQSGYKYLAWTVDVYITYESVPDSATIDQEMAVIIDAIMWETWSTTMPLFIQDNVTGRKSQILAIGEDFELEYPPERTPATLRMLYFAARLGLNVYEAVQA